MPIRSALCMVVLMIAGMLTGEERRTLALIWLDAHGLFPDFSRVRSEAEPIFRDLEVAVRWEVGTDPRPSIQGEMRIHVVLMPSEPSAWGISPKSMGVVLLPERSRQESVYLFYPPILRNAGLSRRAGAMLKLSERRDLSRAIARVLVHEVVHAVAPNLSHADEGVMHDALLVSALLKREIAIDDRTKEEFLRGSRSRADESVPRWSLASRSSEVRHRTRRIPGARRTESGTRSRLHGGPCGRRSLAAGDPPRRLGWNAGQGGSVDQRNLGAQESVRR